MNVGIAIQNHPSRDASSLAAALPGAVVVTDDAPDEPGSWLTARRCWTAFNPAAGWNVSHVLVLEDDAVPCAHFMEVLPRAVMHRPNHAIAFWANRKQIGAALDRGESWTWCGSGFHGTVAVLLPFGWIASFVEYGDALYDPRKPGGHDQRLREWLEQAGGKVLLSAPCLVQHGAPEDSLIWPSKGRMFGKPRVTPYFADELGIDAREIDWRAGDG